MKSPQRRCTGSVGRVQGGRYGDAPPKGAHAPAPLSSWGPGASSAGHASRTYLLARWVLGGIGLNVALGLPPVWAALRRLDRRLPGLTAGLERIGRHYGLHPPRAPGSDVNRAG